MIPPASNPSKFPPTTTKELKRDRKLRQKQKPRFTPSQLRRIERQEEVNKRIEDLREKEKRSKINKRKRLEKEEREREAKRRRIEEGRLPPEAAWGKASSQQERLHKFFNTVENRAQPQEDRQRYTGSQQAENGAVALRGQPEDDEAVELDHVQTKVVGDQQVSPQRLPGTISLPKGSENRPSQLSSIGQVDIHSGSVHQQVESDPEQMNRAQDLVMTHNLSQSLLELVFAEDDELDANVSPKKPTSIPNSQNNTCITPYSERQSQKTSSGLAQNAKSKVVSPPKSVHFVLSEMPHSKVNIRTQEKPGVATTSQKSLSLSCSSQQKMGFTKVIADTLAMISTQDLEDEELSLDKENKGSELSRPKSKLYQSRFQSLVQPAHQHPCSSNSVNEFSDCDEIFTSYENAKIDVETDEFGDGGLDDADWATVSTQGPVESTLVAAKVSQKKVQQVPQMSRKLSVSARDTRHVQLPPSTQDDSFFFDGIDDADWAAICTQVPTKHNNKNAQPSTQALEKQLSSAEDDFRFQLPASTQGSSFAFDGIDDEDLVDLANQLETENVAPEQDLATKKSGRKVPWLRASQRQESPASSQMTLKSSFSTDEEDS